jgi:hypothetical protein
MGTWLAGTFSCCAVTSRLHGLIKKLAGLWRASLQSLHPADWANAAEYRIHHALSCTSNYFRNSAISPSLPDSQLSHT